MNYYIYIVIFISCLLIIYVLYNKNVESFAINSNYSKKYIIEDCVINSNNTANYCMSNAWVKNPRYLCGLCGDSEKNSLYKNGDLYGCPQNIMNLFGLSWSNNKGIKVNPILGNIQTCNSFNNNSISDMYLYICCDDSCNILLNNKNIINKTGWNQQAIYHIKDVKYNDSIIINSVNSCNLGGLCISYIWNKQLFILDNNGYENSANIINYQLNFDSNINKQWTTFWSDGNYINNLLPWMKNWINMKEVKYCNGNTTNAILNFNVGDTQNVHLLTNDLTVFMGIGNNNGTVYLNDKVVYNKNESANKLVKFVIPNVNANDVLKIDGSISLGITYLWCGLLYILPSDTLVANNISYNATNCDSISYPSPLVGDTIDYMPNWLKCNSTNFTFTTLIGNSKYKYLPTIDKWYTLIQNNLVGKWNMTNITSINKMTILFTINIKTIFSWRNIIHVSNQNIDCCGTGNRVPGIWITNNTTSLYIVNGTSINGNDTFVTKNIPLNTPTDVKIIWNANNVNVYFNNILNTSYMYNGILTLANYDASFYIGDPWYSQDGGVSIKNLQIFNTDEI